MIRKLILFLLGLIILALTFVVLVFSGAVYNSTDKIKVEPFFFQLNNLYSMRVGVPAGVEDLGEDKIIERLIKKYVLEYFYVTPDAENIAERMSAGSPLYQMSSSEVFDEWLNTEATTIQALAESDVFRMVDIKDEIQKPVGSDYWVVNYALNTWSNPNDLFETPVVTRGVMFMNIIYESGIRQSIIDMGIHNYLDKGGNISDVFKFRVTKLIVQPI